MTDEPTDLTTRLLTGIREDIRRFSERVDVRFGALEDRLDRFEVTLSVQTSGAIAELARISRRQTVERSEVDEKLRALAERLDLLERELRR